MVTHTQIQPKVKGKSDFFSWQLFRWVRKYGPGRCKIWLGTWNSWSGMDREKPVLYIGDERDGEWIHARLLRNLCTYGATLNTNIYAYGPGHDTKNWKDITDEFWVDYMKRGVCAIHGDLCHEWDVNGDIRTCQYCGKVEEKEIIMVPKEKWNAVGTASA